MRSFKLFVDNCQCRWTVVHDTGMIGTDELAVEDLAALAVDDVTIDFTVAIDDAVLTRKVFVLGMDVEGVGLLLCSAQFTTQVFVVRP